VNNDGADRLDQEWPDLADLVTRRMGEYAELWQGAATKLRQGSYRSEDLLDDWFRLCGKAARDMTAGMALFWAAGRPDTWGAEARADDVRPER
jgi:hypothetical protein